MTAKTERFMALSFVRSRLGDIRSSLRGQVEDRLDDAAQKFILGGAAPRMDFSVPQGEPAFVGPDSISWRIFKNPISLFVGGVTAVLLEFAEPRVRSGVWDHSSFRRDPIGRLRRTGMAAMATVYGARSVTEKMIANVRRMHDRVEGVTPAGETYSANDPDLLNWVQATAAFGFLEAYSAYVKRLTPAEKDRFYAEGGAGAALYGATAPPKSAAEFDALLERMSPRFERSDIVFEFLDIMRETEAFPGLAKYAQRPLIRAAVDLVPWTVRRTLGLEDWGLRPFDGSIVRRLGRRADRLMLRSAPPAQACVRLGLPEDYLYRRR
jgi:uncharacterized protein (DUF2236 family)